MRSPGKLFTAISFIWKQNKISKGNLIVVIILMFAFFTSSAQATRALKTDMYKRIVRPNAIVKVQTVEDGRVSGTHDIAVNDVRVPVNKKSIISYDQKISAIDTASYKKFASISPLLYSREELKIIPELHVETRGSATEAYRIVFTLLRPFRYNNSQKKFNASLGFFLVQEWGNNTGNVSEPVKIEVVSNDVTLIRPDHLQISHLNLPSSKVELIADHISDSTSVKVITTSNPDGYVTYLKVDPSLEIISNRSTLQGLGIQKIPIEVRFIGSNSPDSVKVNFNVGKGAVNPGSAYVNYNKPSTIYLSSEGFGDAKLSAVSNNLQSNDLNFRYTFPWYFLFASILGGLIGGLARYYVKRQQKKFSIKPFVGGILIGFIVAVAYYFLGVNLLGLRFSAEFNEIAVLGLSALGAYFSANVKLF